MPNVGSPSHSRRDAMRCRSSLLDPKRSLLATRTGEQKSDISDALYSIVWRRIGLYLKLIGGIFRSEGGKMIILIRYDEFGLFNIVNSMLLNDE